MNTNEYIKLAHQGGIAIPENLRLNRYGEIDQDAINGDVTQLIENVIDSGSLTIVIEDNKVPRNIISALLATILSDSSRIISDHWANKYKSIVQCQIFIDIEQRRQYTSNLRLFRKVEINHNNPILLSTKFLDGSEEDGLAVFNGAVHRHKPKVILFDAEAIWEDGIKNIKRMKKVLRYCRINNIAVILFLRNEKILHHLTSPDNLIHIWKKNGNNINYIAETQPRIGEDYVAPFEFWYEKTGWISQPIASEELDKIPQRKIEYNTPGIDPDLDDIFDNLSAQAMQSFK